jgi:hypothetical protein
MGIPRRLTTAALTWAITLGVVGVAVHPERCPPADAVAVRRGAELAVDWFGANVGPDGSFVYRYDRGRAAAEPGYNDPRHAGVLFSLYQAESAGITGAAETAEIGMRYVDARVDASRWGTLFGAGQLVSTGAVALLVGALDERRAVLGLDDRDDLLVGLGSTLTSAVTADGAVEALIDRDLGPVEGTRSPFFTGEVLMALSRLEITFPGRGYGPTALAVRRYLVEDRDEIERPFPHLSDHWGAYGWETMGRWPEPPKTGTAELEWLTRQVGLFGLQVRYESQRVGGITSLTRGSQALGAGVGTLGEGIGNLLAIDDRTPFLSPADRHHLVERAQCVAGMLVDRQVTPQDARADRDPDAVVGAWFRHGDTQMDDQQHALSALLILENRLEG